MGKWEDFWILRLEESHSILATPGPVYAQKYALPTRKSKKSKKGIIFAGIFTGLLNMKSSVCL